jgi:hypothetical protein
MNSGGYAPNICREVDMSTHPYAGFQLIRAQLRLLARQASGQPSALPRPMWTQAPHPLDLLSNLHCVGWCLEELRTSGLWADKRR